MGITFIKVNDLNSHSCRLKVKIFVQRNQIQAIIVYSVSKFDQDHINNIINSIDLTLNTPLAYSRELTLVFLGASAIGRLFYHIHCCIKNCCMKKVLQYVK